jgi:hypothetical protein
MEAALSHPQESLQVKGKNRKNKRIRKIRRKLKLQLTRMGFRIS